MRYLLLVLFCFFLVPVTAQETYKEKKPVNQELVYEGKDFYPVKIYPQKFKSKKPKNVILMIGDGMGLAHVFAGYTANGGNLFLNNFRQMGYAKTQSSNKFITDSAAGGTALACGVKTYNSAVGVDSNGEPQASILEEAEKKGLSTGLVSTSAITHATPASFIAHEGARFTYEAIAADFLDTDVDVFIGGGLKHFSQRQDGRDLTGELKAKGYQVLQNMQEIAAVKSGKLAGLTAPEHNVRYPERGDMLPVSTETAIRILSNNKKGFFLMVEGSMIDWGGHQNSLPYIVEEMLDFDRTIGKALEFAAQDGETLVIVTADHETSGLAITGGNTQTGMVQARFVSTDHTGVMVPVFAFGPGADQFTGILDNTDIQKNMKKLLIR